jgi:large conductance mechanosensitive channel
MANDDEILKELKGIRAALEKPAPPPPAPPKGLYAEFKAFLSNYKVLGLAVGFVLGLYLGGLVQALVKDLIMPTIGLALPGISNLATLTYSVLNQLFAVGDFLVAVITFIIVAFVVFLIVKVAKRMKID